jgi:hypothetical protein
MDQRNPAPPWMVAQQNNGMFTIYQAQDFATDHPQLQIHISQWEFQDPKLEVPTIYKAYVSGLCK